MLVISQLHRSQLHKDASLTTQQNSCIYCNFQPFLGLRYTLLRYDNHRKIELNRSYFEDCRISAPNVSGPKRCFDCYQRKYFYLLQLPILLELICASLRCDIHKRFDKYYCWFCCPSTPFEASKNSFGKKWFWTRTILDSGTGSGSQLYLFWWSDDGQGDNEIAATFWNPILQVSAYHNWRKFLRKCGRNLFTQKSA